MDSRVNKILLLSILIGVILRILAAFYLGNQVVDMPGTADQISYHNLALRVLQGHGFTFGEDWWPATQANSPTAHWSFLYTGYLVLVYALFGPNPLAARLIQAVLVGILQPLLAFLIGRRVFGRWIGLAAGVITALYAYFIYYAANLMTESFYILAILAALYISIILTTDQRTSTPGDARLPVSHSHTWRLSVLLGISLAAAVLLRQVFLLFVPFLFLWILLQGRRYLPQLALSGLLIVLAIIPFTLYNYARFDRFVLLNTNSGFAFFWGNHPIYGTHFESILPSDMGSYQSLIPEELHGLDEAALDQALLRRGIGFVLDDPLRYVLLSISRIPPYFMFWPSSQSGLLSNIARVASFGLLWPFMLYGLVLSIVRHKQWLQWRPPSPIVLLYAFILIYSLIHILTWTLIRYRLPVDAVLILFAGLAVVNLLERIPVFRQWTQPTHSSYG
ncbi:MAG: glycosyltransferase family 39 protein [Anaerolineales bacterium]|jgi:4-amino-4-deoxy-L-arabinose transferase-like glycosyltransferase